MKKFILHSLILIGILSFSAALAQESPQEDKLKGGQRIKALYVAFMTRELNLTEQDAQKFWPIHLQYDEELKAVNEKKLPELDREEACLNVRKKYLEKFNKVLGAERTDNFYKKDAEFRKKLVERLREKRKEQMMENRPNGPRGGKRPPFNP